MIGSDETRLAPYATRSGDGGQRAHAEPEDPLRTPFERDRHRIIECTAFRRLEGKTQVFAPSRHDHFRTRLTHTLEVAHVARCLARGLRANETLAEAIAFAHDLGHPPFGHAGEAALAEAMRHQGGFNHNSHSLRVVEYLEHPYPSFRGLNLTRATLDGLRLHSTRYDTPEESAGESRVGGAEVRRDSFGLVEAQIASLADRIAFSCHDLEDAIGGALLNAEDLAGVSLWRQACHQIGLSERPDRIHAVRRVVLDSMLDSVVSDTLEASHDRLAGLGSPGEVAKSDAAVVAASDVVEAQLIELEQFLLQRVYRHPAIAQMDADGRRIVLELFDAYRARLDALPDRFAARIDDQGSDRVICDYIAGMTDRFCRSEHARVVANLPDSRRS